MKTLRVNGLKWYNYKHLCETKKRLNLSISAKSLCDIQTNKKSAGGGYGLNIAKKLITAGFNVQLV